MHNTNTYSNQYSNVTDYSIVCDVAYFHILVPVGKEIMNPKYKLRTDVHVMQLLSH